MQHRRLVVYKRADGLFDWRRRDRKNGQVVATSGGQGYSERNDAREAAHREFPDDPIEDEP